MSRVKNRDTDLERVVRSELHKRGLRFRKHVRELTGTPDIVFPRHGLAVFIDGDFWHGWRYPSWKHDLTEFWRRKIETNRERDRRNFRSLRRDGWNVIRVWQHEIEADMESCVDRIQRALQDSENENGHRA
jgi:DNA mismatch endonuclease (patch repair protein)